MQHNLFEDLSLLAPYLSELQEKIENLQKIKKLIISNDLEVSITLDFVLLPKIELLQKEFPFDLLTELNIIIDDSIDMYQKNYATLSQYKHQLDK